MYTQQAGRKFLEIYNKKTGKNLSALDFFEEEFFPVLFDSEDHLQLMQVHNSPFFQTIGKKDKNPNMRDSLIKKEKLLSQIEDFQNGKIQLGGNIAVGYKAKQDSRISRQQASKLEEVYKTQFSLEKACSLGGLGIKALQPKDLYKYTAGDACGKAGKLYKLDKEEKRITFITYITWIQAMLNNEETLKLSEEVAEALLTFEGKENRLRTRIKQVEGLWEARNRQQFIDTLSSIMEEDSAVAEPLNKAVEQLMISIPQDMFKLFLTLIKFKYNYYQSN